MKSLEMTFNHETESLKEDIFIGGISLKDFVKKMNPEHVSNSAARIEESQKRNNGTGPRLIAIEMSDEIMSTEDFVAKALTCGGIMAEGSVPLSTGVLGQIMAAKKEDKSISQLVEDARLASLESFNKEEPNLKNKELAADLMCLIFYGTVVYVMSNMGEVMMNAIRARMCIPSGKR